MRRQRVPLVPLILVLTPILILVLAVVKNRLTPRPADQAPTAEGSSTEGPSAEGPPPGLTAHQWARLEAIEKDEAGTDEPDQFQRILYEMRVPSDRTTPEYAPGYRVRELQLARAAQRRSLSPLPWVERGPGNIAGRTRGLIVDPDDTSGDTWIIGTVGGGVWKTTDAGATWTNLTPDLPDLAASAIAMAGSDHDVLYLGTGESFYNIDTVNGDGMFKSTDRGQSWFPLSSTTGNLDFNNVARIIVDPSNPDIVLAATTTGRYTEAIHPESQIMKSTDGGVTWTQVFVETEIGSSDRVKKVQQILATPGDFDVQYGAVDEKGILKSTDAGDTWVYSNSGITDFSGRFELAISPLDPTLLFASAEGSDHSELWVSTNAGASWNITIGDGYNPNWLGSQGWYDNTILCNPDDSSIVYVGGIYLWQLNVNLSTFHRTATFLTSNVHVDHHNIVVVPTGGTWHLLNSNDGGVGVSASEASSWHMPIDGLITTQFYGVDKRPGASAYLGGMQDNSTWFSGKNPTGLSPWTFAIGGDGYETSWKFDDPLWMIGSSQYNGLARSTDGGVTWQDATNGLDDVGGGNAPFISKIAKSEDDPNLLFAVGAQGVWRSTDFGGSWSLIPLSAPDWSLNSFIDVKISRANPDVVWAGAYMDDTNGRVHRSTDGGLSFSPVSNYGPVTMGLISGMATHPTDDQTAYVLFSYAHRPKILRTTDGGASWEDISGFGTGSVSTNGFPDVAVYDLLVRPDDPNILWAGTEIGLVESTDNGATWALADNGLPSAAIWAMTQVEDEVVVATHGLGIWSVSIPEMIAGKTFSPLIERLYQAPAAPITLDLNLRSAYDSTQVLVDDVVFTTLGPTSAGDSARVEIPVVSSGTRGVQAKGYFGGTAYPSPVKNVDVSDRTPQYVYVNDFNNPSSDFLGSGFTIGPDPGFSSDAIHSPHPYADETSLTYTLTIPIVVASDLPYVEYDDVALVEPGDPGSVFGDGNFWDYVVVEGTSDGLNWQPIADGYDSRLYPEWLTAWNNEAPGDSTLLRHHQFDLSQTFPPSEEILLRFRLFADQAVHGWGWAIDNLEIQVGTTSAAPNTVAEMLPALSNFPNPFRDGTNISFNIAAGGRARLRVYDAGGRLVETLLDQPVEAGPHTIRYERPGLASGIYFARLTIGDRTESRRMVVIR
jgi:photosystem II stability/assembly factor-like uncharacterized protein